MGLCFLLYSFVHVTGRVWWLQRCLSNQLLICKSQCHLWEKDSVWFGYSSLQLPDIAIRNGYAGCIVSFACKLIAMQTKTFLALYELQATRSHCLRYMTWHVSCISGYKKICQASTIPFKLNCLSRWALTPSQSVLKTHNAKCQLEFQIPSFMHCAVWIARKGACALDWRGTDTFERCSICWLVLELAWTYQEKT